MNWFKRHLNLTWFIVVSLASQMGTLYNIGVPIGVIMLFTLTLIVGVTIWVLYQKGRDFLWVVCPISVLFLCIVMSLMPSFKFIYKNSYNT